MQQILHRLVGIACTALVFTACSANSATHATSQRLAPFTPITSTPAPPPTQNCSQVTAIKWGWQGSFTVNYTFAGTIGTQQLAISAQATGLLQFAETATQDPFPGFVSGDDNTVLFGALIADQTGIPAGGVSVNETLTDAHQQQTQVTGNGPLIFGPPDQGEYLLLSWDTSSCSYVLIFHGGDTTLTETTPAGTHTLTYPFLALDTGPIPGNNDPHLHGTLNIPVNTPVAKPPYFEHTLLSAATNIGTAQLSWDFTPIPADPNG